MVTNGQNFVAVRSSVPVIFDESFEFTFTFSKEEIKRIKKESRKVERFSLKFSENTLGEKKYDVAIASFPEAVVIAKDLQFQYPSPNGLGYPSYKWVLKEEYQARFATKDLLDLLDDLEEHIVYINIQDNQLTIGEESILIQPFQCDTLGDTLEFHCNKKFLIQSLELMLGPVCVIKKDRMPDSPFLLGDSPEFFRQEGVEVQTLIAPVMKTKNK